MKVYVFLTLLLIEFNFSSSDAEECPVNDFACADGKKCISKGFVCDDYPNCLDHSDEEEQLCENWEYEYEYEDDDGGGGGWFGFLGGSDEDEDYNEELEEEEDNADDTQSSSFQSSNPKPEKQMCSLKKCIPRGPLNFVDSREYKYSYKIDTKTQAIHEGQNQTSATELRCDVVIKALTACEMSLKVENVVSKSSFPGSGGVATEGDENSDFLQEIEKHPLRFTMSGGEVETLCPEEDEDLRALNFKRGVLSALQNTMPQLHLEHHQAENDVVGRCDMKYRFEGSNAARVVVSKTRDIFSCDSRSHFTSAAQGVPYNFPMESDPLPIVDTSSKCNQEIEGGIIRDASCVETHRLTPLNHKTGSIITTINQKLSFVTQSFFIEKWTPFSGRTNLIYRHIPDEAFSANDGHPDVESLLDKLEALNEDTKQVGRGSGAVFKSLVTSLRRISTDQLLELFQNRQWTNSMRQHFLDAVGAAGTASTIRFTAEEMPRLTPKEAFGLVSSLHLLQSPDAEAISALGALLRAKGTPDEAYLAGGSLLNTYCLLHPSCTSHEPVTEVLELYQKVVNPGCKSARNPQTKTLVMSAIRGIGNSGLALNDVVLESLNKCILERENEPEVIGTSIEAFRRVPCNVSRSALRETFADVTKDSELRILSYLGLMKCVDYETVHLVEEVFRHEEVNQVGSFIWTHLTNLQESSLPSKIEVQSLLSNRDYEEKFKSDFRKFSKNIEWSGFFDELNIGAGMESNLIFSQNSYVPRQANLNLTLDLFGRSFNALEVGARMEGFERFLERIITGAIPEEDKKSIKSKSIRSLIKKSDRSKEYQRDEPQVSLMMKVFGNDVWYNHREGMNEISNLFQRFEFASFAHDIKEGKEMNLKRSVLPLETTYQLATSSGLPLKVTAEGAAVLDIGARLQMDLDQILSGQALVNAALKPSLSVDLKASMIVDGYSSSTGIEMDSSFHSSINVDGRIEIDGKNSISVDFNLPQDKMQLFTVTSKLLLVHGQREGSGSDSRQSRELVRNEAVMQDESSDCLSLEKTLALVLCWSKRHPSIAQSPFNYRILMNGPVKYELDLSKSDTSITTYKFRYQWMYNDQNLLFYMLYDTPGSTPKREHVFKVAVNFQTSNVQLLYTSPHRSIEAKGLYVWTQEVKRLNVSLNIDGRGVSTMSFGYKVHERGSQIIIIPIFQIDWANIQLFSITGNLESISRSSAGDSVHYGVDLQFNLDTSGIQERGVRARGSIGGSLNRDQEDWELTLESFYRLSGIDSVQKLNIYYQKLMQRKQALTKTIRSWKVTFTQFPYLNTKGKWASKSFDGSIENGIEASFGTDYENPLHKVEMFHNLIFYGGREQTTFNSTIAIKYPKKKLDVKMGADLYNDMRDVNAGMIFQYASGQAITSRLHLIRSTVGPIRADGSFYFIFPEWADVTMRGEVKQTDSTSYEFDFMGSVSKKYRLELTGHYNNLSTRLKSLYKLEMKIKYGASVRNILYTNSTFLLDQNKFVVASKIKTRDGSKYTVRFAYTSELDDLTARHRRVEFDLTLPTSNYYWHSEIVIGQYITISNDIHIDGKRDVNLWIEISRSGTEPTSIKVKLLWDANRDPHKRANLGVTLGDDFFTLTGLVSFFGNEYRAEWKSSKTWLMEEEYGARWTHDHRGMMSWMDEDRTLNEILIGGVFNLTRNKEAADLEVDVFLSTPLETWKENSAHLKYERSANHVVATLKSKWHKDEFLNLNFNSGLKQVDDGQSVECQVDILSLINENLVTLKTGAVVTKTGHGVDGSIYLRWDKDEVVFRFDAKNASGPKEVKLFASAEVSSTMKGYSNVGVSIDLFATSGSLTLRAEAEWEDLAYELKCIGVLHSAEEYLKGEIHLTTPQYGPDTASAKLRVYHDTETHEEKLMIGGHWLNEDFSLHGLAFVQPKVFRAALQVEIPYEKLSQASLLINYSSQDSYMTEVWAKWNNTKELGFKLMSRLHDLTDLLLSVKVKTPFPNTKEVCGELRNLFKLTPSVRVNWRAFGQLDHKKYGLGAIYEQGSSPKLRVGLEVYYPSPDLQEVKFLIADNSTATNMRYNFELRHGEHKQIHVQTDFKRKLDLLEFSFKSAVKKLSFLVPMLEKMNVEGEARFYYGSTVDFLVKLASITPLRTNKIGAEGSFTKKEGKLEGNVALPFKYLEDLNYKAKALLPEYNERGYLEAEILDGRIPLFKFDAEGNRKDFYLTFATPVERYREGHMMYKLVPKDIQRSEVLGSCALEDLVIKFNGLVHVNQDGDITKLEVDAETLLDGFQNLRVTLEGKPEISGFSNLIKVTSDHFAYDGEIFYRMAGLTDWKFMAKVKNEREPLEKAFSLDLTYRNVNAEPIEASTTLETPFPEFSFISFLIKLQTTARPYKLMMEWDVPKISGSLDITLESFTNAKILGSMTLGFETPQSKYQTFTIKTGLTNDSTKDHVRLGIKTNFSSSLHEYSNIVVDGWLNQVTPGEPGVLTVYLVWPDMNPVNFTAMASYLDAPFNLRTSAMLDLTSAIYGFAVEEDTMGDHHSQNVKVWWQRPDDDVIQEIVMKSSLEILSKGHITGEAVLLLPMIKGFESNKANFVYKNKDGLKELNGRLDAGTTSSTVDSRIEKKGDGMEGEVTVTSSEFRGGNPVSLSFYEEAWRGNKFTGNYQLEWPVWDMKTRSYTREFVKSEATHRRIPQGMEGTLRFLAPVTNGKEIVFNYHFRFPKNPEAIIKFGVVFDKIKVEVKLSHLVTVTEQEAIKETSVELDNLLWPFGVAYVKTVSLLEGHGEQKNDKLMIYDLQNTDRRSSLSFLKKIDKDGGMFSMKVNVVEREMKISFEYKNLNRKWGGNALLMWSETEKIDCLLDVEDLSASPEEKNYKVLTKIEQPLRTVLLQGDYIQNPGKLLADFTLNTDLGADGETPMRGVVNYETSTKLPNEKHIQGTVKLTHPSLANDISLTGEFDHNYMNPLLFNLILNYSNSTSDDLIVTADVKRGDRERTFQDKIFISHVSSSLLAEATGSLKLGGEAYSFDQDFSYTSVGGQVHKARVDGGVNFFDKTLRSVIETSKRVLDLRIRVHEKAEGHWELETLSETHDAIPMATSLQLHPSRPNFVLLIDKMNIRNQSDEVSTAVEDIENRRYTADKIMIEGGVEDGRSVRLSVTHLEENERQGERTRVWTRDVDFALKLNHSRLLTSHFLWRKMIEEELLNEVLDLMGVTREFGDDAREWTRNAVKIFGKEAILRAKPILKDVVVAVKPLIGHLKNETKAIKKDYILLFKNVNMTQEERDLKESIQFTINNIGKSLNELDFVKKVKKSLAKGTLRKQLQNLINKIREFYSSLVSKDSSMISIVDKIKEFISNFASSYDNTAKRWYLLLRNTFEDFKMRLGEWLKTKWHKLYFTYKPHIFRTIHDIESTSYLVIKRVWEYMNEFGANFKSLSFIQKMEEIYTKIKSFYDEIAERNLRENLQMLRRYVSEKVKKGIDTFFARIVPFVEDWMGEVKKAWAKFSSYESVGAFLRFFDGIGQTVYWSLEKVNFGDEVIDGLAFVLEHGYTILTQKGVDSQFRRMKAKSDMKWNPGKGEIHFTQKLPFQWNYLTQAPNYKEMFTIPYFSQLKDLFTSTSQFSVLDTWYRYFNLNFDPLSWIPPFEAVGYVVGDSHFLTFDGQMRAIKGSCEHVLAADVIYSKWAITIKYNKYTPKTINVYTGGNVLEFSKKFKVKVNGRLTPLPASVGSVFIYRTDGGVHLMTQDKIGLSWNLFHDVVSIRIAKEGFLHTAGLLGTNNNEPTDDLQMPDGSMAQNSLDEFMDSWLVRDESCSSILRTVSPRKKAQICDDLFSSKVSPFRYCFYQVDPAPYYTICNDIYSGNNLDTSPSAFAYRETCRENAVPIKLPSQYVRCEYKNATSNTIRTLQEGETRILRSKDIENAMDVVILIELKECNRNRFQTKRFHRFVTMFNEGLRKEGVTSVRFALVSFGGKGSNWNPSVVTSDIDVFTSAKNVAKYVDNLDFGTRGPDGATEGEDEVDGTFAAITYASNLPFGSPVTVTFALFPCVACTENHGFDFPTMYHILMDNGASLYVFKNDYFDIQKTSMRKKIIGYDENGAFTLKDHKRKEIGDPALKKQISPPKDELNDCLPLSLETKGAVFTSSFLFESKKKIERFGMIVGRRAGGGARLVDDQRCLCFSTKEVTPLLRCDRWNHGDFSVLERYGLDWDDESEVFDDIADDSGEGFYKRN